MRGAVCFERPHFHFAEALTAELRLAAEGLLRDERIRTYRAGVDLVVDEVDELYHVLHADGDPVFEGFARSAVVDLYFAVHLAFGVDYIVFVEELFDVLLGGAVEYGGGYLPAELLAHQPQVHFEHLTDVHSGRHAEGVENYLQRGAVRKEGHIRLGKHAGDDALVAVAARHLVADLDLALLRDIYAHELVYSGRKFVLVFAGEHLYVDDYAAFTVGDF